MSANPEWIDAPTAASLLGVSLKLLLRLGDAADRVRSEETSGRPYEYRRADIERIRHVRLTTRISMSAAAKVAAALRDKRL